MKVIVTTSGLGSRLGGITDNYNKSLVRVGDKPAISRIIDYYPQDTDFVITLGHFGDYVQQFIEIAYPDRNFEFVWIDDFSGPDSSLGYSLLKTKRFLQEPFVFHACDTILKNDDELLDVDCNWIAGAIKDNASQYRTIRANGDEVEIINRKGEINFDYVYVGVCGIKDYKLFWSKLESFEKTKGLSDAHVINLMLEEAKFKLCKLNQWYDTGNVEELEKSRIAFQSEIYVLDKNDESIYMFDNHVIKFFTSQKITNNRVKRVENLDGLVPKLTDCSKNFYKYEKAKGDLLSECVNPKIFKDLLDWAKEKLWLEKEYESNFQDLCFDFYYKKTADRIKKYLGEDLDCKSIINGISVDPVEELLDMIDFKALSQGQPVGFHGDFILDNILYSNNEFVLLDWRQDFSGCLSCGDIYYDLAKLNHNLTVNHAVIDRGWFDSSPENCSIFINSTNLECKKILCEFTKKNNLDLGKIEILTSIIWLNMAPLHEYPFNKFLFNYGKLNLHNSLRDSKYVK